MLNQTVSEIDAIMGRVNTHPEYSGCVWREKYHALREEAEKHSLKLELESEDRILKPKERKIFLGRLKDAEDYLLRDGIDHISLSKLGNMIAPKSHPYPGFRRIGGVLIHSREDSFETPEPKYILPEIMDLISFLRDSTFHPVLRASNSHIEMVRIHPYEDGNGRAGRLLQNLCLQERGYPPAIIRVEDRKEYLGLMGKVWRDRLDKKSSIYAQSPRERHFHEFIASKVLDSVRIVEDELKSRRMYKVELTNVSNPAIVGTVAKKLKGIGRQTREGGLTVSINKKNGHRHGESLGITGDISQEELRESLAKFCLIYGLKFNITGTYC